MKRIVIYSMVFWTIAGLVSCADIQKSFEDTFNPDQEGLQQEEAEQDILQGQTTRKKVEYFMTDAAKLDQIQMELQNLPQFKGKKINMYNSIYIFNSSYGSRLGISIQNPDTLENIDDYIYYEGSWQSPEPKKVRDMDESGNSYLLPLDSIRFSTIQKVYTIATEKAKEVPGAEPIENIHFSHYYIKSVDRNLDKWSTTISGQRNDYYLTFDKEGNLVEMEKH